MLIALLAVLGVDLIVIVVLLAGVLSRKRWVGHQPGVFRGSIRVTDGELRGVGPKWRRGYGHWVSNVLVWTKAPLLLRNVLVPADRLARERDAAAGDVKRLGDRPIVVALTAGQARVEIAVGRKDRDHLRGPWRETGSAFNGAPSTTETPAAAV
jgi:hypothetical protein